MNRLLNARDVIALLALAVVVRVMYVLAMPRVLDTADAIHYIESAQKMAAGDLFGFNPKIPVLYPALTALASYGFADWEAAACFVSFVAGTLLVLPVFALARDLHGRNAARVAGLTVALWPWLADYSNRVAPDMLAATLWITSVWLLSRGLRRGGWYPAAAALSFFALHLARPEGTFLLTAAPLAALVLVPRRSWRDLLRLVPYALVCAALLGAYALYMSRVAGHAAVNYRAARIVHDFEFIEMAKTALHTVTNVLPVMLGPVLLLFIGVGFFYRPSDNAQNRRDLRLEAFVLFYCFSQWFLTLFVLSPEPRYQMSVLISLSMWSAAGIAIVTQKAAALRPGRWLRFLPVASLVALMLLGSGVTIAAAYMSETPQEPIEYREAGLWMRDNLEPGLIFSRKPQIGYYAAMPTTGPALDDSLQAAIARAQKAAARYVVVDERYTASMVPSLATLLDPALAPPALKLVRAFNDHPGARVMIYEIAGPQP